MLRIGTRPQAGVATLPLVGSITRALQFLFVARRGTTGAACAPALVYRKAQRWGAVLLAAAVPSWRPQLAQQVSCAAGGAADAGNKFTMVGDIREQVARRELDRRFPRCMLAPEATTKPANCLLK